MIDYLHYTIYPERRLMQGVERAIHSNVLSSGLESYLCDKKAREHGSQLGLGISCEAPTIALSPTPSLDWIRRLRNTLFNENILIDMTNFVIQLSGEDLISLPQEEDISKKQEYRSKIEYIFSILLRRNPDDTKKKLLKVLERMRREDIILSIGCNSDLWSGRKDLVRNRAWGTP
ncbi:unnamed protein product [Darwinula stevensoni]|uniref:Uncharacterized protein n=1 Tax=Darwinula stevensoni TaxID=69355 RepID=A0A7R9AFD9_9CRUS|nr:unnamed protein product [Darwinula stevensoni]CAG0902802.1 unnamed protein product [Darwinula stevensoni]